MRGFVRSRRGRLLTVASVVAIAAIGVTAAWAAIGDGGVVKTCFSKNQGTWRPVDSAASCKAGESEVAFYSKAGADAAFLGKTAKAADSDKLDGIDSTGFLSATGKAADSDKLDGIDSTGFLSATGKAADSEKLDGIDSTGFVRGGGTTTAFELTTPDGTLRRTNGGDVFFSCISDSTLGLQPGANAGRSMWFDNNGTTTQLAPFDPVWNGATGHYHSVVRISGGGWLGQWDITASADGSTCKMSVLETVSPLIGVS